MTGQLFESNRRLDRASAQLAGWGVLAGVDAVVIELTIPMPEGGLRTRLLHHLHDCGQLVALGIVACLAVKVWRLAGSRVPALRRSPLGYLAITVAATVVAEPVLAGDLVGAAGRPFGQQHAKLLLSLMLGAAGLAVAMAARVGTAVARAPQRWAAVFAGIAVGTANQFVLLHDYPGVHFYLAWGAATLMGAALTGARLPFAAPRRPGLILAALSAPAFLSLVRVPNAIALELLRLPGAVAAPLAARMGAHQAATVWQVLEPKPDVPPSLPSLIPADGIVIVLCIDALRADIAAGGEAVRLPDLEALRRDSVEFTQARSPASGTIWTLASLFSGRYYSQLFWTVKAGASSAKVYPYLDSTVRFPEVLGRGGIPSLTVSEMPDVSNNHGITRGVTREFHIPGIGSPAGRLVDVLLAGLNNREGEVAGPRFAYVHFLDAHYPYTRITKQGTPHERYVGELSLVTRELGRLRRAIAERGLAARTTIVLTADHGEAFGEHGTTEHATSVYDELLRVPLLIHVPGVAPRRVDRPVSLLDLGPTVLDLMGQPTPGTNMGESLVPFLRGQDPVLTRVIAAETGRLQQAMLFPDGRMGIRDQRLGTFELFDLATDPGEMHSITDRPGVDADDYLNRMRTFFYVHAYRHSGYHTPIRW